MSSSTTLSFPDAAAQVTQGLDIVAVVSQTVRLKKAGRHYSGLCPFHDEKSPSFNVNREKGFFKCFGCGVGGDAITFLMKRDNITYGTLIRELAEAQGLTIIADGGLSPDQSQHKRDLADQLLLLNQGAQAYFLQALASPSGQSVRGYLANRDCPPAIQQAFGLGFAPAGWDNLLVHLHPVLARLASTGNTNSGDNTHNQPLHRLIEAGLAVARNPEDPAQGAYDRFRNRLMIPIEDDKGRLVGFGGRALSDEDKPKYLNSPETPLFVKNRVLYGLSQAKEAIKSTKTAVVMEGYFDVISAHATGITQAVASCGTALTEGHLKLLTRYGAETVYLSFDADKAGQAATLSAISLIESTATHLDLRVKVIQIPNGKDPDDFIRSVGYADGGEAFKALMASAPSFLSFKLDKTLEAVRQQYPDAHSPEFRVEASSALAMILGKVAHPVLQEDLTRHYASQLQVSLEAMSQEVRRHSPPVAMGSVVQFQKSVQKRWADKTLPKRAIIDDPRSSFKQQENGPTADRLPSRPQGLTPRRHLAEAALFSLLLLTDDTPRLMFPFIQATPALSPVFTSPVLMVLAQGVAQVVASCSGGPSIEGFVGRLTAWLNHLTHHPLDDTTAVTDTQRSHWLAVLAERVFAAEHELETHRLGAETGATLATKVHALANQYLAVLTHEQRRHALHAMATQVNTLEQQMQTDPLLADDLEGDLLQQWYPLRDKLTSPKTTA
jgi:DNA primase catalytic core